MKAIKITEALSNLVTSIYADVTNFAEITVASPGGQFRDISVSPFQVLTGSLTNPNRTAWEPLIGPSDSALIQLIYSYITFEDGILSFDGGSTEKLVVEKFYPARESEDDRGRGRKCTIIVEGRWESDPLNLLDQVKITQEPKVKVHLSGVGKIDYSYLDPKFTLL